MPTHPTWGPCLNTCVSLLIKTSYVGSAAFLLLLKFQSFCIHLLFHLFYFIFSFISFIIYFLHHQNQPQPIFIFTSPKSASANFYFLHHQNQPQPIFISIFSKSFCIRLLLHLFYSIFSFINNIQSILFTLPQLLLYL